MDWLTADLVLRVAGVVAVVWVSAWISGSALFFLVSDDASEMRARARNYFRARRLKRAEKRAHKIRVEWNPRSTAMRGEFQAK
jgi:hypothetical protein